jgi:hypothetical protein
MKEGMKDEKRKEDDRMEMMRQMHEGPTRSNMREPMPMRMKRDKRGSRKMER